jgi:hypothetical protein
MRRVLFSIPLTLDQHLELELTLPFAIMVTYKKHRIHNFLILTPIVDTNKVISIQPHSLQGKRMEIIFY